MDTLTLWPIWIWSQLEVVVALNTTAMGKLKKEVLHALAGNNVWNE